MSLAVGISQLLEIGSLRVWVWGAEVGLKHRSPSMDSMERN